MKNWRVALFFFLTTPAILWLRLCALISGGVIEERMIDLDKKGDKL